MASNSSRSTTSAEKSNRSSASKKRKPDQKTLGMAWGANSLSSSKSKSSSRNSPFSDFGSYMTEKNRKLHNQFDAAASLAFGKPIFTGVSIFVDGFTVPSSQELKSYMLRYGGRFENYFSRRTVTHIICSNLPDSKVKNLRSFSCGLPVVKPMWVLDCVAANKLLNWVPYQLDQLVGETRQQPKLSAFFALKSNSIEDAETPTTCHMQPETECSFQQDASSNEIPACEVGETLEYDTGCSREVSNLGYDNFREVNEEEHTSNHEQFSELKKEAESSADIKDERSVPEASTYSPCRSSASANAISDNRNVGSSSNPKCAATSSSNKYHSTLGDPNFVENYFKNSRLHFIGTWRNRYRKRFPSLNAGVKTVNPSVTAPTPTGPIAVIHVDMDCFFVSVVIRNHPELQDKPVAVCHSDNPKGTAEISSANYPARYYGVRVGTFVRDAKALCPHLVICPYNFEAYEEVADQFYSILHKHSNKVQALSCDEAFLDVTDREDEDPECIASIIRQEIVDTTGCTASAGIAGNLIMARLATRAAKPNGQCHISAEKVESFLDDLPIKALPGIGHVLEEKLKKLNINTCSQLRMVSKESLQKDFGTKTGDMLWSYSRGIDNRRVGDVQETKSIGAEVNWGVRFNDVKDSQKFLASLCNEVSLRLHACGVQGRTITMKVKKRRNDAQEPTKYMGCGDCENFSHSTTVPVATDDAQVLQRISKQLLGSFQLDVKEIRGIGVQVSRLEGADVARQGREQKALRSWLASASAKTYPCGERLKEVEITLAGEELLDGQRGAALTNHTKQGSDGNVNNLISTSTGPSFRMQTNQPSGETSSLVSTLPPIYTLDMDVIESLPPEIFAEVNEMYGGKLSDFMDKTKAKDDKLRNFMPTSSIEEMEGARKKGKEPLIPHCARLDKTLIENKGKHSMLPEIPSLAVLKPGTSNLCTTNADADHVDLMPASLSQMDMSVLQQLPEELKFDILESLPAHRRPECLSHCPMDSAIDSSCGFPRTESIENHMEGPSSIAKNCFWAGNPPEWVEKFEVSNHLILNLLAEMYHKSGSPHLLSSIMQCAISMLPLFLDVSADGGEEALSTLCELLQQYIELNIKKDMEEIYICFRLLKRFSGESIFFFQVYDKVLPYLQASFIEHYGGQLNI